ICLAILLLGCDDAGSAVPDAAPALDAPASAPDAPTSDGGPSPDLGATPYPGGTTFRVWAPHATAVSVVGHWNSWEPTRNPPTAEPGGRWAANVPGVTFGAQYRYSLTANGTTVLHIDPRAERTTGSKGNGVVDDPRAYAWQSPDFRAAPAAEQ